MTLALSFAAALMAVQASADPPDPPPAPCATEAHRAFDFWVGNWEVFTTGTETQAGESRIESLSGGCAIRETWMPLKGPNGTSITLLNHRSARWEQLWIGGDGKRVDFTGGMVGGNMVLTGYWDDIGGPGKDALVRMTFTPNPDGSVRQAGEASADNGKTWNAFFDFTYVPKAG
ncbi:MAG: hypothetical protein AAFN04_08725 [Pseudomonadota bacterium]